MKKMILLIQFLTRIPININLDVTRDDLSKSVIYFPVVGLIIGVFLSGIFYLLNGIIDKIILSFLIITVEIIITGGLHLDGLSDTFDGIFSNREKNQIIEIMKDPNVGTFGVLSLIVGLSFKFLLIMMITKEVFWVLLLMPIFSRFCVVFASRIGKYPKEKGLGNLFIGKVNNIQLTISFIFTIVFIAFIQNIYIGLLISVIFTYFFVKYITKKIDGITGDILGAIVELNEILFLFVIYIMGVM